MRSNAESTIMNTLEAVCPEIAADVARRNGGVRIRPAQVAVLEIKILPSSSAAANWARRSNAP
jgi:hypothetical protein